MNRFNGLDTNQQGWTLSFESTGPFFTFFARSDLTNFFVLNSVEVPVAGTDYLVFAFVTDTDAGISVNGSVFKTVAHTAGIRGHDGFFRIGKREAGATEMDGAINRVSYGICTVNPTDQMATDLWNGGACQAYVTRAT
jgi:hypothetical protein